MIKRLAKVLLGWGRRSTREKYLLLYRWRGVVANVLSPFPVPLPWLLHHFGSDKHRPGWHGYGPVYQALFRAMKYQRIQMLEIGIGGYGESLGGTSLLAWQAFLPRGTIHGADIEDKTALARGRRHVVILDQSSAPELDALKVNLAPFDLTNPLIFPGSP